MSEPPYLVFDGRLFAEPSAVLTERDGEFVELPSERRVDPVAWLHGDSDQLLAGYLGYEFGWHLLDVRAPAPDAAVPSIWVGRFDSSRPRPLFTSPANGELTSLRSRVSAAEYEALVQRCIDDIYAGELFEVNLTTRFDATWTGSVESFHAAFTGANSGDWFGLLHTTDFAISSVSPEEFVRVDGRSVATRPIKGTIARSDDPDEDRALAARLAASEKDRAENIMIVDLMRNDLTRVCELGTVETPAVCEVESFVDVHHLVSTVTGTLREDCRPIDVLLQCFPAGSITGAPKLRAMELAAAYEPDARGAYTGSFFVARPDGTLRSNVLIRTATLLGDDGACRVEYGAGGAIVADSEPGAEWRETLAKTRPIRRLTREMKTQSASLAEERMP